MNTRCLCTKNELWPWEWQSTQPGKKPDANCKRCKGTGTIVVEVEQRFVWYGFCRYCESVIEFYVEKEGDPPPPYGVPSETPLCPGCFKKGKPIWKLADPIPQGN